MTQNRHRIIALLPVAFTLWSAAAHAQAVTSVTVGRSNENVQTSDAPPVINPAPPTATYGGPYGFEVSVRGSGLSGMAAPVAVAPPGARIAMPGIVTCAPGVTFGAGEFFNDGVLGYHADEQAWNLGAPFFNNFGTTNPGLRGCLFPGGIYTVTVAGQAVSLNLLPTTSFVNAPHFTLTGGAWVGGTYVIDVNQPLGIESTAFAGFAENVDGLISSGVEGPGGPVVNEFRLYSDEPSGANHISYTIAPRTLTSGETYDAFGTFAGITDKSHGVPGSPDSLNAAFFSVSTSFRIAVVGVPDDVTPPTVTARLVRTNHGGHDDDGEQAFRVEFSSEDAVGVVSTTATLNGVPVINGQVVTLKRTKKGPQKVKFHHGKLTIHAPSFTLTVVAADAAGNSATATATPEFRDHGRHDSHDRDRDRHDNRSHELR